MALYYEYIDSALPISVENDVILVCNEKDKCCMYSCAKANLNEAIKELDRNYANSGAKRPVIQIFVRYGP